MLNKYLFTLDDAKKFVRHVAPWQWAAMAGIIVVAIILASIFGADLTILIIGLAIMGLGKLPFRLPLSLAIAGLVLLMAISPFVEDENNWESLSENIAVGVFFMLVFAVFRLGLDALFDKDTQDKLAEIKETKRLPIPANIRSKAKAPAKSAAVALSLIHI